MTRVATDANARVQVGRAVQTAGDDGFWVPTVVVVECLTGSGPRDARVNAVLKHCEVIDRIPLALARRAALLRTRAGRGSAVDAIVVALAEPGGLVFTGDPSDLAALASHARNVSVERI